MSDSSDNSGLPRHAESEPGAEVKFETQDDGGVEVHFSDGSESLDVSRREFMRISGVAAATAAMSSVSCRNPEERIVPYVDRPEEVRVGHSNQYTSVCSGCSSGCGIVVKTQAGRPVKLEGNENHPINEGSLCAKGQSSYMRLYDPERVEEPLKLEGDGKEVSWEELDKSVVSALKNASGIGILTKSVDGASEERLFAELQDETPTNLYEFNPLSNEQIASASQVSYGRDQIPKYRFDRAQLIVSLGSDFLGTWLSPVEFTGDFSENRDPSGDMNRLIAFEGSLSLTGANADDRHRVRYSDLGDVALGLAHELVINHGASDFSGDSGLESLLQSFDPKTVSEKTGVDAKAIKQTAKELLDAGHESLIVAGGEATKSSEGESIEIAVNLLNEILGNVGHTIERSTDSYQRSGGFDQLSQLEQDANNGELDVLIVHRANPAYSAASAADFKSIAENVDHVIYVGDRANETAQYADWLATETHALEQWNDSNPISGVHAVQQPTIRPLYNNRPFQESILKWFSDSGLVSRFSDYLKAPEHQSPRNEPGGDKHEYVPSAWYRYVVNVWQNEIYAKAVVAADFEAFWQDVLREGVWQDPNELIDSPDFELTKTVQALPDTPRGAESSAPGDLSNKKLHLFATTSMMDGSDANNGHLQELPHSISKHTWGSYVLVSPETFREADLENGDLVKISAKNGSASANFPVIMQPGLHDDVVSVPLGYGRTEVGVVGDELGENGFAFASSEEGRQILTGVDVSIEKTGETQELAVVQGSNVIDADARDLIGTATLAEYDEDPHSGNPAHAPGPGLWEDHDYGQRKWGMSIDLTTCTGCNACVSACREENNIPVVGRQGVMEGREMDWIRIDRYYKLPDDAQEERTLFSDPMYEDEPYIAFGEYLEDPEVLMQPMMCQHCENAPCETVCPVAATTHSDDGLNQMTYNRCVGTRYCSNNCPFKVRRFNWYNYSEDRGGGFLSKIFPELDEHGRLNAEEPMQMGMNPEVTVRSRGVMEKCTFCVQRIRKAETQMKEEGRSRIEDGEVVTACQEACPADAIDFGNLLDEDSSVAEKHADARALTPMAHLNVKSSVAYLTAVKNKGPYGPEPKTGGHGHGHKNKKSDGGGGGHH